MYPNHNVFFNLNNHDTHCSRRATFLFNISFLILTVHLLFYKTEGLLQSLRKSSSKIFRCSERLKKRDFWVILESPYENPDKIRAEKVRSLFIPVLHGAGTISPIYPGPKSGTTLGYSSICMMPSCTDLCFNHQNNCECTRTTFSCNKWMWYYTLLCWKSLSNSMATTPYFFLQTLYLRINSSWRIVLQ